MNLPVGGETAKFKQEYFKYYEEPELQTEIIRGTKKVETVILVDPAKSISETACDTAIIAVGIDREAHALYIRDVIAEQMLPNDLYRQAFLMADRFGSKVIGYEETSLVEFIRQPFKNAMHARGSFYELVALRPRGGESKTERIGALSPYYRDGSVYHNPTCCAKLEGQLLAYPRAKSKDVMDVLSYIVQMMELGERYFEPPGSDDSDPDEYYAELEGMDDELPDDWREI
jgi:phage terminase large subunit-like protein